MNFGGDHPSFPWGKDAKLHKATKVEPKVTKVEPRLSKMIFIVIFVCVLFILMP